MVSLQKRTKEFLRLMRHLKRCSAHGRQKFIQRGPQWFIDTLILFSKLYMQGRVSGVSKAQRSKLAPYQRELMRLAKCRQHGARKVLVQRGGFLPILAAIPALIAKAVLGAAAGAGVKAIYNKIQKR